MADDGVSLTIRGLAETKAALLALPADLRRRVVRQALRAAARPLVAAAQSHAPILKAPARRRVPGTLRNNIKVFNSKKANGQGGRLGVYITVRASKNDLKKAPVTGDPYYWRWVEGGHRIVPRSRRTGTFRGKALYAKSITLRRKGSTASVKPYLFLQKAYRERAIGAVAIFNEQILARVAKVTGR